MNQRILFENQTSLSKVHMQKIKIAIGEKQFGTGDLRPALIKYRNFKNKIH